MAQTVWRDAIDREMQVTDKLEKRKTTQIDESMQDRLAKLLESFTKFASAKEITVEKEPREHALHEERETRLQEADSVPVNP
jgi:hypothetical protein